MSKKQNSSSFSSFLCCWLAYSSVVCNFCGWGVTDNVEHRKRIAAAMSNCKDLTEMSGLWDLDEDSVMMLMPIAPHLTRLDLTYALLGEAQLSDFISSCVNLYDLKVEYPPTHPPFYFLHWAFNNDISFVPAIPWMFLFPHWHRWQILLVMRGCE